MKRPALQDKRGAVLRMAFRVRKVFGTFRQKRTPGPSCAKGWLCHPQDKSLSPGYLNWRFFLIALIHWRALSILWTTGAKIARNNIENGMNYLFSRNLSVNWNSSNCRWVRKEVSGFDRKNRLPDWVVLPSLLCTRFFVYCARSFFCLVDVCVVVIFIYILKVYSVFLTASRYNCAHSRCGSCYHVLQLIGGAETKSGIAHFIAILLMNSCYISEAPIIYSPST